MSREDAIAAARSRLAAKAGVSMAASKEVVRAAPTTEQGVPGGVLTPMGGFGGRPDWAYFVDDREFAAELQWPRSVEVNERMETTDAQVKGLLLATFLPVRRMRWELDPAEARPEAIALAHEDLNLPVRGDEDAIARRGGFNHDRHLGHSLRAVGQGHYHFEEVLEYRDDGLLHLKKLGTRPPRSIIGIRTDDHGNLEAIEQMSSGLGFTGGRVMGAPIGGVRTLDASRLLVYLWDTADDGDQVGRSVLRACYRNFLVKDALIRVDAPHPLIGCRTHDQSASQAERRCRIENALAQRLLRRWRQQYGLHPPRLLASTALEQRRREDRPRRGQRWICFPRRAVAGCEVGDRLGVGERFDSGQYGGACLGVGRDRQLGDPDRAHLMRLRGRGGSAGAASGQSGDE